MRPCFPQRLIDLGDGQQARLQGDGSPGRSSRVTRTVRALVEHAGYGADLSKSWLPLQDAFRQVWDGAHPFPLDARQRAGPVLGPG